MSNKTMQYVSSDVELHRWTATEGYLSSSEVVSHDVGTVSDDTYRLAVRLPMPTLPNNACVKKAELTFTHGGGSCAETANPLLGVYEMASALDTEAATCPLAEYPLDYAAIHCAQSETESAPTRYTFDVTNLVDKFVSGESERRDVVLKLVEETAENTASVTLYGVNAETDKPQFTVFYETSVGSPSSASHTHELGAFGQVNIDLQTRTVDADLTDFAWGGNRMPVTVKHAFSGAMANKRYSGIDDTGVPNEGFEYLADFRAMNVGRGWRLNLMQSMCLTTFVHDGETVTGYAYADENGDVTYFKETEDKYVNADTFTRHDQFEDVDGSGMIFVPDFSKLFIGDDTYLFDSNGRLTQITDTHGNAMTITYTDGRITAVTDGAGRVFTFTYDSDFLKSITAPDGTAITYAYSDNQLSGVTYPENKELLLVYTNDQIRNAVIREDGTALCGYYYTYDSNDSDRLQSVAEMLVDSENNKLVITATSSFAYSAAANRAVVTTVESADADISGSESTTIYTVYTFDDEGDIISTYAYTADSGNIGLEGGIGGGVHPYVGENGMDILPQSRNGLRNHSFASRDDWTDMAENAAAFSATCFESSSYSRFGNSFLSLETADDNTVTANGVYQETAVLQAGEHTFSAYVRVLTNDTAGAYLRVTATDGTVIAQSETLTASADYIRLAAPFVLDTPQAVRVCILFDGKGKARVDGAQLEQSAFMNDYNLLENGHFECGIAAWDCGTTAAITAETFFNGTHALKIEGNLNETRSAHQTVSVKTSRGTKETFTLSGWAKANSVPLHERDGLPDATFGLRARIVYAPDSDFETNHEDHAVNFCACTDEWQFVSLQFEKAQYRKVENIEIHCDYDCNVGTAYFDDLQLVRNVLETDLSESDFAGADVESDDDDEIEDDEDDTVQENDAPAFEELTDAVGNPLTETTFQDGEFGTLYRAFAYGNNDNDLIRETDARGGETTYTVDSATSRNAEVVDRLGNKTAYEYDDAGRTVSVQNFAALRNDDGSVAIDADGNIQYPTAPMAEVSYAYNAFDAMTEIARGDGLRYVLAYNQGGNLVSIGIDGKAEPLVQYAYKNGNGRLKQVTFANGHTMAATYNTAGHMIAETWRDADGTLQAKYKYVYDGEGNIVRSIDISALKEYTYSYEDGKLMRAAEYDITVNDSEMVTSRTLTASILYSYDSEDNVTCKRVLPVGGAAQITYFETTDDNTVVKFTAGGKTVTAHSKTDSFGRKEFDELQLGSGFLSRQFRYLDGEFTDEHAANDKLKSSPTTQLVSEIRFADGRTISYEYDEEDRITKVTDSVDGVTAYTYDALGQLLTETRDGVLINEMAYVDSNGDGNYGNIVSKNGVLYQYDSVWKDLLTQVGDQTITYDAQGNPTQYLGHTLSWEKGRQLKSFDSNIQFAYNANGIRTSKTVNGTKHEYLLDGTKILRESWGSIVLVPLYDNEDSVCGIEYNGTAYFFVKNLQGDIIAITNSSGEIVARYSYDAWGVCTIVEDESNCGIATINPFRYRGYYYDTATNLYYLQSRYYDPQVGRFINADEVFMLLFAQTEPFANGLFPYCGNSPIVNVDIFGYAKINIKWVWWTVDGLIWLFPALYSIAKIWKDTMKSADKLYKFSLKLIAYGKKLLSKLDDRLYCAFSRDKTYRRIKTIGVLAGFITVFFSIGVMVQYIIDILDGKWDGYLDTGNIKPKLDLTKDY